MRRFSPNPPSTFLSQILYLRFYLSRSLLINLFPVPFSVQFNLIYGVLPFPLCYPSRLGFRTYRSAQELSVATCNLFDLFLLKVNGFIELSHCSDGFLTWEVFSEVDLLRRVLEFEFFCGYGCYFVTKCFSQLAGTLHLDHSFVLITNSSYHFARYNYGNHHSLLMGWIANLLFQDNLLLNYFKKSVGSYLFSIKEGILDQGASIKTYLVL